MGSLLHQLDVSPREPVFNKSVQFVVSTLFSAGMIASRDAPTRHHIWTLRYMCDLEIGKTRMKRLAPTTNTSRSLRHSWTRSHRQWCLAGMSDLCFIFFRKRIYHALHRMMDPSPSFQTGLWRWMRYDQRLQRCRPSAVCHSSVLYHPGKWRHLVSAGSRCGGLRLFVYRSAWSSVTTNPPVNRNPGGEFGTTARDSAWVKNSDDDAQIGFRRTRCILTGLRSCC